MTKLLSSVFMIFLLIFLNACASKENIVIKTYKNQKVNLDGYKKYQWLVGAKIVVDDKKKWRGRAYNINTFVERQIANELMDREIYKTQINPDFLISYVVGINMDALEEAVHKDGEKYFKTVPEAGLGIVFLDPLTKKIIWASQAESVLKLEISDEESKKRVAYAIKQMFSKF